MPKEISAAGSLNFSKGSRTASQQESAKFDSGIVGSYRRGTQLIRTTKILIDVGNLTVPGWIFLQNNDETDSVDIYASVDTAIPLIRLYPGEFFSGRLASPAPAAMATASVMIEYLIIDSVISVPLSLSTLTDAQLAALTDAQLASLGD